ncbi:MAG: hypothetical protein JSR46_06905, partial [Verrucomicrobia bacterium]|nr:hypothetical protein [Verrucomicrobiota bacterium]
QVGLIDFGWASRPKTESSKLWEHGSYGTYTYTAPELLENKQFNRDGGFGTDMWALGAIWYQKHFKTDPPWFSLLDNVTSTPTRAKQELPAKMRESVERETSRIRKGLEAKPKSQWGKKEHTEELICRLLSVDPSKRPDIKTLKADFQKLKSGEVMVPITAPRIEKPVRKAPESSVSDLQLTGGDVHTRLQWAMKNHAAMLASSTASQSDETQEVCRLLLEKILGHSGRLKQSDKNVLVPPPTSWTQDERKMLMKVMWRAGFLTKAEQKIHNKLLA